MISRFILKIKRKENAFYSFLYDFAKLISSFHIPSIKILHLPLYYFDYSVRILIGRTVQMLWCIPLFKARCRTVGRNLRLPNGMPLIVGHHLNIYLGDNVCIMRSTIGASKVFDSPVLRIGNNSGIGYGTTMSIAKEIIIGDNCMIGPHCLIMDNDDHPINPQKRLNGEPINPEDAHTTRIGNNVWIGSNSVVLKGVTIGDNSVIGAHSVVTKNVEANCVYSGYPARPTMRNIDKIN